MKNTPIELSEIQIIPIKPRDGLLGFVSFLLNGAFYVGNISLRVNPEGQLKLVYPQKTLPNGKVVNTFHPISTSAANQVLHEVEAVYDRISANAAIDDVTTSEDSCEEHPA